jgi:hypothetical protein
MMRKDFDTLLEYERHRVKAKQGGGVLSFEVWGRVSKHGTEVTRYNLAYINHDIFQGDNGRVLGFDNAHGYHHRHFMGRIEAVGYISYEETLKRFQQEWSALIDCYKEHGKCE